jgi:hypothetical protein
MSNDNFKKSPIHDKKAIIDMMDELEPGDMIEVVEFIKSKQQHPTPKELWLMSEQHAKKCGLQNFFDDDEIIIIRHHWIKGYEKAMEDFLTKEVTNENKSSTFPK